MTVFISYSHEDKPFVEKLAAELVNRRTPVWVDEWELRVGDSLIERIEKAIEKAKAILVVLSKASVESAWCRKELSSGLIRELTEKRVVVLPLLIEDCEMPVFLRDKVYADFRNDFNDGLGSVVNSIARVVSDVQGHMENEASDIDWAIYWGDRGGPLRAAHQAHRETSRCCSVYPNRGAASGRRARHPTLPPMGARGAGLATTESHARESLPGGSRQRHQNHSRGPATAK